VAYGDRDAEAADTATASKIAVGIFQDWNINWFGQDNATVWIDGKAPIRSKTADFIIPTDPLRCTDNDSYLTISEGSTDNSDFLFVDYILVRRVIYNEPTWVTGSAMSGTSISVTPSIWSTFYKEGAGAGISALRMDTWYTSETSLSSPLYTLANTGFEVVDILISSSDNWTGTGAVWHVSPTGDPGDHTIGLWCGLDADSDYRTLIKPDDPANFLLTNLAAAAHDHFGLKVFTCTSNGGNASMTGRITLVAVVHT
jgi:hypothetical protein